MIAVVIRIMLGGMNGIITRGTGRVIIRIKARLILGIWAKASLRPVSR